MKISERTVSTLARIITGDLRISPYRSGPDLVRFFNEFGSNDVYGRGFPSRWFYAEEKTRELNGTPELAEVIHSVLDPRDFLRTDFSRDDVVELLNEYLKHDGYELVRHDNEYRVRESDGTLVDLDMASLDIAEISHVYIDDQNKKCERKIFEGDFAGAITNARSLLEAILLQMEKQLMGDQDQKPFDGDLPRLLRRVLRLLDLDPDRQDISDAVRQVLRGLVSAVLGLATLRNRLSDAHGTNYVATKQHAKLAVNAVRTVADFIVDVFMEQTGRAFDEEPIQN